MTAEKEIKLVDPIRDLEKLEQMKSALKDISYRDYMIFYFGLNTGMRISDILKLKVGDVKDRDFTRVIEGKTQKQRKLHFKNGFKIELNDFCRNMNDEDFLFKSKRSKKAVDKHRVYRVFNKAGETIGIRENIGTHTMRKTFGYHFYKQYKDVARLQKILNHSSPSITLSYIGIDEEEIEKSFDDFSL